MMPCKLTSPTFAVTAAVLGGLALAVSTCQGAVIDLFDHPQRLSHANGITADPVSSETTVPSALFPLRRFTLEYGEQTLVVSNSGSLDYEVAAQSERLGYFSVQWTASTPVNLLSDGSTAFQLMFDGVSGRYPAPRMFVETADGNMVATLVECFNSGSPGGAHACEIPFDSFLTGGDLTEVSSITMSAIRIPVGSKFRLSSITTIPEPTSPVLGSLALLLFLTRRRRLAGKNRPIASSLPRPRG